MLTVTQFVEQTQALPKPISEELMHALINNYVEGHYLMIFDLLWREDPKQDVSESNESSSLYDIVYDYLWDRMYEDEVIWQPILKAEKPQIREGGAGVDPLSADA